MCNLSIYKCKNPPCRWKTNIHTTLLTFWCGSDLSPHPHTWTSCHDPKLTISAPEGLHCPYFTPSTTTTDKETTFCNKCREKSVRQAHKKVEKQRRLDRKEAARMEEKIVDTKRGIVEMVWREERERRGRRIKEREEREKIRAVRGVRWRREEERRGRDLEERRRREQERRDRVLDEKRWEFEEEEVKRIEGGRSWRVRFGWFGEV
ncbi:hypothetical protein HYALB_00009229 [Hymenoscyphus albidus]|uniref:Uncharacterized protein n=1 Tax=Hymenoscyphus albidus TaxID=595503 RepID=A0A9N9PXC1_9HELO|nr:hypothetical protein HYALB_00009229 [Hymenoscyphus albidus]